MASPAGRTLKEWLPVILGGLAGTDPYAYRGIRAASGIHDRQVRNRLIKEQEAREREREKALEARERNVRSVIQRVLKGEEGPQVELLRASAETDPSGSLGAVMRYVEGERTEKERGFASRMSALKERMAQRASEGEEKARAGAAQLLGVGNVEGARRLLADAGMGTEAMRLGTPSPPSEPQPVSWQVLDKKKGLIWNPKTQETKIIPELAQDEQTMDMSELLDLEEEYNDAVEDVVGIEEGQQEAETTLQQLQEKSFQMQAPGNALREQAEAAKRKLAVLDAKLATAKKRAELAKMKMLAAQRASVRREPLADLPTVREAGKGSATADAEARAYLSGIGL